MVASVPVRTLNNQSIPGSCSCHYCTLSWGCCSLWRLSTRNLLLLSAFLSYLRSKSKGVCFIGLHIKKGLESTKFSNKFSRIKRTAWNCFIAVVKGFLGNHRAENHQQLVQDLVKAFGATRCEMPFKFYMLGSLLEKFKDNMGTYLKE